MYTDISYWHTTAKDKNYWLKTIFFFVGENTNGLKLLHSSVYTY